MKHSKRAKVLASLSKAPLLVFAGTDKAVASVKALKRVEFASHECAHCHTVVAFGSDVDGVEPVCPTCGGEHFSPVDVEPIPVDTYTEDNVSAVTCPNCGASNAFDDRILAALGGHVHCAACGHAMHEEGTDDSDENIYDVTASDEGDEDDLFDDFEAAETEDLDDDGVEDEDEDSDEEEAGFARKRKVRANVTNTNDDLDEDSVKPKLTFPSDNTNPDLDEVPSAGDVINTNPEISEEADLDVDLLENADEDSDDIEIVQHKDDEGNVTLLAFVDGVNVATLDEDDAGDKADLIGNRHFRDSLEVEAKTKGVKALASYGFKPVTAKVSIAKIVTARVRAALIKETASLKRTTADVRDDFDQSFRIAIAALNAGYYRNRKNPLVASLVGSLKAMGVSQAASVVKRAMQTASEEFVNQTLELTDELLEKPVEVRNEIADNLSEINPDLQFESAEDEGDDVVEDEATPEDVVARLSTGGRVTASVKKTRSRAEVANAVESNQISEWAAIARANR